MFRDFVDGLKPGWFTASPADFPIGCLRTADEWKDALQRAGFGASRTLNVRKAGDVTTLLLAEAPVSVPQSSPEEASEDTNLIEALKRQFASGERTKILLEGGNEAVILLGHDKSGRDKAEALAARCLDIKSSVESLAPDQKSIWFIFRGAFGSHESGAGPQPVAAGAWAFTRTLANEQPSLDIRRVDIAPDVSAAEAAMKLRQLLLSATKETEFSISRLGLSVVRADMIRRKLNTIETQAAEAARLERRQSPGQRLQWQAIDRVAPAAAFVEIEVQADRAQLPRSDVDARVAAGRYFGRRLHRSDARS